MKNWLIIGILLIASSNLFGQSKSFLKAQNNFTNGAYKLALVDYKKAIKKEKKNFFYLAEINYKIAECERLLNDTIILKYYLKSIELQKKNQVIHNTMEQKKNNHQMLAKSYFYTGDYIKTEIWFERLFKKGYLNNELAKLYYKTLMFNDKKSEAIRFRDDYINQIEKEIKYEG